MRGTSAGACLFAFALALVAMTQGRAEELAIQSFNGSGRLVFNTLKSATNYHVECATSPAGPWTNSWNGLVPMPSAQAGSVTCSVPVFYRVVATVTNDVPSDMVTVPAGTNSGLNPDDWGGYNLIMTAPLYMDVTEVTKKQWDEVFVWAVTNGYEFDNVGSGKEQDHPVQTLNWYDCVKWCNARSEREGRTPAYYTDSAKVTVYRIGQTNIDDNCVNWDSGFRLPTVTEWEYAARGGISGTRFPWGDIIDHDKANYKGEPSAHDYDKGYAGYDTRYSTGGAPYTSPVGAFAANGYGLCDMAGNVWEWCWDAQVAGLNHSISGGCYDYGVLPFGWRSWAYTSDATLTYGFRTVRR